jgi:hypothetical protein
MEFTMSKFASEADLYKAKAAHFEKQSNKLLAMLKRVVGSHYAPEDCYATGPLTGDYIQDLVACPSCQALSLIAEIDGLPKG